MPRFRLDIEYDGSQFAGWQHQADQPSVQQAIEQAIEKFCGQDVRIRAAGRTDAGVHASAQVAHVDLNLIRNAFQFRLMLEREAVATFVREAPDAAIARLREAHERVLKDAARRITPDVIRRAQLTDWDLHDTVVDSLGNEIVSSAYRVNSIKIRLIRQAEVRLDPTRVESVMREHLGIVERMEKRDIAGSQDALCAHIVDARNRAMGV